jgi:apolipoprotein N-acyltransferase
MIAISNNGWFHPSIEPTLQKLLMRFYAKKHHSIIYHSANMGGTGIIKGND